MSYDLAQQLAYTFPLFDYGGASAETYSIQGPPGKEGKIVQIGAAVTENFAASTTKAKFEVGTAADADAFALLDFDGEPADNAFWDQSDDPDAIIANIPADQLVRITHTPGTGTPTGQAIPILTIAWY